MTALQTWSTARIAARDLNTAEMALARRGGLKVLHLQDWYEVLDTYTAGGGKAEPYPHGIAISSTVGGLESILDLDLFLEERIYSSSAPIIVAARVVDPRRSNEAKTEIITKLLVWSDADLITIQVPGPIISL